MAINTYQNNDATIQQTFSTTPTVTTQYFQQQQPTLSNLATSAQSTPQQTQHVAPMIQNTNQVPLQPQLVYTPMQPQIANQPQPQINQTNSLEANLANKFVSNLEQQLKDKTTAQTNTQQVSGTLSEIDKQIRVNAEQKINDIYKGQQKAEEEKQKEFERLKEENERFKKEEEARKQKEENDKKLEDELSEIESRQRDLDDREDYITLMEKNALLDEKEFTEERERFDMVKDIKLYNDELENTYNSQYDMITKRKDEQLKLVSKTDKEIYNNAEKLDKLNEKLNRKKAGENIFVKIINFITGHEDKESKKIKEEIKKLSKKIDEDKISIEEQREELKKIEKNGLEILRKKTEDMAKNSQTQMDELKERRKQYDDIVNSHEYKTKDKEMYKDYITNILSRRQEQVNLIQAMANKRNKDIYSKYGIEKINQDRPKYSKDTINQKKQRVGRC